MNSPSTHRSLTPNQIEWGFVGVLAGLCSLLMVLQYRWTGEVSQAEERQLRANLAEAAELLGRSFDSTLSGACQPWLTGRLDLEKTNWQEEFSKRSTEWLTALPQPLFSRVGLLRLHNEQLEFYLLDLKTGQLTNAAWPENWSRQPGPQRRPFPGPAPFSEEASGLLLHFPLPNQLPFSAGAGPQARFGHAAEDRLNSAFPSGHLRGGPGLFHPPGGGGGPFGRMRPEQSWVVMEVDATYLRQTWLPHLVQHYLNPGPQPLCDVQVRTLGNVPRVLFGSSLGFDSGQEPTLMVPFNHQGHAPDERRWRASDARWALVVEPRTEALDALVGHSRWRNLAVAAGVNLLLLAAGLALLRHSRRSRQLAEAQMSFVANVSHELRTPLTVLRGAGHNLLRGIVRDPEQIQQYSKLILRSVDQLSQMVEQVLTLAGTGRSPLMGKRQPVELAPILREAVAATEAETEAAGCTVAVELPVSLPWVEADALAVQRVFQNLLSNAAKHAAAGRWIGLSASVGPAASSPCWVEVKVSDRGPGIPEGEQKAIFEPFVRGSRACALQVRGCGLGLSLVREIVQAHGGTIAVQSAPGQGATFIVRLPALPAAR